jgi:predicted nucleic acid-binding protein
MGILLDTGFLYSLKDEDDLHHSRSVELIKYIKEEDYYPIITTSMIINETYTVLMHRTKGNITLLRSMDNFCWGNECFFRIVELPISKYQKISNIMAKYSSSKKMLSFADASLIYLSQRDEHKHIVSFDSHFDGIITRIF